METEYLKAFISLPKLISLTGRLNSKSPKVSKGCWLRFAAVVSDVSIYYLKLGLTKVFVGEPRFSMNGFGSTNTTRYHVARAYMIHD